MAVGRSVGRQVFPTRVGVDRVMLFSRFKVKRFPHTRGGGPYAISCVRDQLMFSPHAWGWTVFAVVRCPSPPFSPHVWGWTETPQHHGLERERFPHTRGGGPQHRALCHQKDMFSPHAWGWTEPRATGKRRGPRFPHTRGGGPPGWWWRCPRRCVFPTRVGVDRIPTQGSRGKVRFPHTRGGGPSPSGQRPVRTTFSPHAWGWTVSSLDRCPGAIVFPTRVGVDRPMRYFNSHTFRFPHTRGGGP